DRALSADVFGRKILGEIFRQQRGVGKKGKEIIEELAASLLVDGYRFGDVPLMAGLGGKDEVPPVGAASDNAPGRLTVAKPEGFDVALELGDSLAVRGGVVGRAE